GPSSRRRTCRVRGRGAGGEGRLPWGFGARSLGGQVCEARPSSTSRPGSTSFARFCPYSARPSWLCRTSAGWFVVSAPTQVAARRTRRLHGGTGRQVRVVRPALRVLDTGRAASTESLTIPALVNARETRRGIVDPEPDRRCRPGAPKGLETRNPGPSGGPGFRFDW